MNYSCGILEGYDHGGDDGGQRCREEGTSGSPSSQHLHWPSLRSSTGSHTDTDRGINPA